MSKISLMEWEDGVAFRAWGSDSHSGGVFSFQVISYCRYEVDIETQDPTHRKRKKQIYYGSWEVHYM